mmetsp:Transcript_28622/g.27423  ORF Transcript_28622/g.27423 Transcript_28622/m.27423 type:complete len:352 (+) Transcript_28622:1533-2588(+)
MKKKKNDDLILIGVLYDTSLGDKRLVDVCETLCSPVIERIPFGNEEFTDESGGLDCALYIPDKKTHGPGPYPTIVSVYGGPGPQRITNMWLTRVDMRAQRLAQHGFLIIRCDNRGSARRGLVHEGALKNNMGDIELQDQIAAIETYGKNNMVDLKKVGIYGWSYGGYLSAMALCRSPFSTYFQCGIAGAPVTSWDGYDTHYTERYMSTPLENVLGYTSSSVLTHTNTMTGKLLLIHGLIDENVHFRHTARFINSLIESRKRYDLILFPCERHSPHKKEDKIYMEDRIHDFFMENLSPDKIGGPADYGVWREVEGLNDTNIVGDDNINMKKRSIGSVIDIEAVGDCKIYAHL